MGKLAMQFMKRVVGILDVESITYDKAVVAEVIQKHFPDWRRVLNELQRYSSTGTIDSGILANMQETSIKDLISLMRDKNYTEIRKWVKNNLDSDVNDLYRQFYDVATTDYMQPSDVPALVVLIAKYQYQNAFAANIEINFMAFIAEVLGNCDFK
jgi:hypothetical protein